METGKGLRSKKVGKTWEDRAKEGRTDERERERDELDVMSSGSLSFFLPFPSPFPPFPLFFLPPTPPTSSPRHASPLHTSSQLETNLPSSSLPLPPSLPADILLIPPTSICLTKTSTDLTFHLVGPTTENELMLHACLSAFHDAVGLLLKGLVEKRTVLENLDLVMLALDETVDDG